MSQIGLMIVAGASGTAAGNIVLGTAHDGTILSATSDWAGLWNDFTEAAE